MENLAFVPIDNLFKHYTILLYTLFSIVLKYESTEIQSKKTVFQTETDVSFGGTRESAISIKQCRREFSQFDSTYNVE
jgi:hypothetical protein